MKRASSLRVKASPEVRRTLARIDALKAEIIWNYLMDPPPAEVLDRLEEEFYKGGNDPCQNQ